MPLPIPKKNESQSDFVGRCISFETHASPDREAKQIQAICFSRWREFRGGTKLAFFEEEGGYVKEASKMWRKPVLAFGIWKHPENRNVEFEITPDVVLQIIKNFKAGVPKEAPVVLTHTDNPKLKVGTVKDFVMTPAGLDAVLSVADDDMNGKIEKEDESPGVSCWLDLEYRDKQTDAPLGAVIKHVALVNHPYIEGLGGWQTVSLSDDKGRTEDFTPLFLSEKKTFKKKDKAMAKITKEEAIKFLKEEAEVDVETLLSDRDELVSLNKRIDTGELVPKVDGTPPVLSEDLMTKVKEQLKLGEETPKVEELITALLDKIVKLSSDTEKIVGMEKKIGTMEAESQITALVASGFVFPKEKEGLTQLYLSDPGLFKKMIDVRKAEEPLIKLSEEGVNKEEEVSKEKAIEEETKRQIELAEGEGYCGEVKT